jgi:DNA-binding response OmpR family regulator/anti-sigma regulatory factor (Ser/Thr protein kinase)
MSTILVIEDEESIRENICEILRAESFTVVDAENGKQGVSYAQTLTPDLILCDVMMPDYDGYYVLSEIRSNPSTQITPFIFLTAKTSKEDMRIGMDLGADDYLTKPFTRGELMSAITTRLIKQVAIERKSIAKLDELRFSITRSLPHEFHTPLNGILSLSKLLREDYDVIDRDEALDMLEAIYSAGDRLYKLTQNFLLYSRLLLIEKNPEQLKALRKLNQQSPTKQIIRDIALEKAKEANREGDLRLDLQETIIPISQPKIKKIVEEVIDNAFKFSRTGTTVTVASEHLKDSFHLSISDRGRGMTETQIASIGAYMQHERETYEQQGSGLGLSVAKLLVELHGGEFLIDSIPGKHTSVVVIFSKTD